MVEVPVSSTEDQGMLEHQSQELPQEPLIARAVSADGKACPKLREHDEG